MKLFFRAISIAIAVVFLTPFGPVGPAVAAEPALGAVFNSSDGWAISKRVSSMILAAPAGSAIRVALFRFKGDDKYVIPALRSALALGVKVKVVVDKSSENPDPLGDGSVTPRTGLAGLNADIKAKMGGVSNNPANDSYLITCNSGCIGDGVMHNKFFLFSTMGTKKEVTFLSTSNVDAESATAWQAAYSVAGASTLYAGFKSYFDDLANQRSNQNYYKSFSDGIYKAYLFPRASSTSSSSDPTTDTIVGILGNVKCSGNSSGVKSDTLSNATMIRIATWGFTRVEVAKKILALAKQGCRFDIVVNNSAEFSSAVRAQLHHANINVDNALDVPKGFTGPKWMHAKYLLIDGNYDGARDSKIAFFGSHNFTINALRHHDEYWLKISSASIHDQFVGNFRTIITAAGNMPGFHA